MLTEQRMPMSPETPTMNEPQPSPRLRSNAVLIVLATVCVVFAPPYGDDRGVEFARRWWQLHDTYLDGVAATLKKYKDVHGRYPDNNQGLHTLDTFDARFEAYVMQYGPASPDPDPASFFRGSAYRNFWHTINDRIKRQRADNGQLPRSTEGLEIYPFFVSGNDLSIGESERRVQVAISQNNCFYLLGPNCVYDPSITPYVYENRNGLDGKLFTGSIANIDPRRKFSREVAQGIYVYSYNARDCYRTYREALWARQGRIYLFGTLALGLFVVAAFRARKYRLWKTPLVFPAVTALLAFGLSSGIRMTCYIPSSMPRRQAKDLEEQKRLLEKFRSSGVINAETYGKAMKGFETDAVFVPLKDPGPSPE